MGTFYFMVFGGLAAMVAALEFSKTSRDRINTSSTFSSFKNNYLLVYSLMMAGDWLQGPYVCYLYSQYGFGKGEIGQLFIAGFGSSMLFGTIVGSLADKQGRKRGCIIYCITYTLSCATKHSPDYNILMLGLYWEALLLLFFFQPLSLGLLRNTSRNVLVGALALGPVAPFDAAACFLAIGMAIIMSSWTENYGDAYENKDLLTQFKGAAVAIASGEFITLQFPSQLSRYYGLIKFMSTEICTFNMLFLFSPSRYEKIALLGAIQSLFEGSMYTFVFLWTPALSPNGEDIPHGFIFATFMMASMLGSSIASRLMAHSSLKVESYMQIVFVISAAALFLPVITSFLLVPLEKGGGISFSGCIQLIGFCTFEVCVGIFWPSIMKMRSQYIPEEARSTIMNFFSIPLNMFVCIVLYNVSVLLIYQLYLIFT
ncbi:hypothetical protein H0E87_002999 [Populus deltoides]|uniref:Major facilitator superfamily protein n=1 Tax=Populus deltoides TaxID=3696 RepID=A0A8T2ZY06_POPDE|nr:hypothetical protein H0E87_002999 [Populus deltoides]